MSIELEGPGRAGLDLKKKRNVPSDNRTLEKIRNHFRVSYSNAVYLKVFAKGVSTEALLTSSGLL